MNQSPFKCFANLTTHLVLKLKHFVLLVMKGGYNFSAPDKD